jgi:hypothetical protein
VVTRFGWWLKKNRFKPVVIYMGPFKLKRTNENPSSEITEVHWFCKTMIVAGAATMRMEV